MAARRFVQFMYTVHNKPVLIDCNFIVDSTNGNGMGCRSLKGGGVTSVLMHSTVPATGNNVPAGYIQVNLTDSYNRYLSGFTGGIAPLSGTPVAVTAAVSGTAYVITSLGTTTQAQWQAMGLTPGVVAAPGVAFVASGSGSGTGSVQVPTSTETIGRIEVVGDPNTTIMNPGAPTPGGYILMRNIHSGSVTAPADGSVISLAMYFNDSSVQLQGE